MNVALIGYGQSGRSSLYRAAGQGSSKGEVAAVPVPDVRFDRIVAQVRPKKATPATVLLHDDLDAVSGTGRAFGQRLTDQAKKADALIHVVRAFESPTSPFFAEVNPARDAENVKVELVLADLQIVENRLERLQKSLTARTPGSPDYLDGALFAKLRPRLEAGVPIRRMELDEGEWTIVRNYQFLSAKPLVLAVNVNEADASAPPGAAAELLRAAAEAGESAFAVSAAIEAEIAQMAPEDRPEFLASMGLDRPASEKLVQAVYAALGLITFFTAGENDTRAWPLRRGASALKAAATIHNDIARGFIRAEVVHYPDYDAAGSLDAAYSAGKMSLEGKEYVVQDGDLLHIRNKT